ncbi:MAG: hypothetical protein JXR70_14500 [Spirochaetales bacterium]|nr:hypothetical protein [Spirochaetales bacterium]
MKSGNFKIKQIALILICLVFCTGQIFSQECGDVNSSNVVDIVDALLIAQYYVGLNLSVFDASVADVSGDGAINIVDTLLVAQYYVGILDTLSGCNLTPTPIGSSTPTNLPEETDPPEQTVEPGSVDCSRYSTWSANTTYSGSGGRVIYKGILYEQKWYTVNENPEDFSGAEFAWKLIGTCDPNTVPHPITPIPGANGYATRYWDCCKPHCSWPNNLPDVMPPLQTCAKDGVTEQSDPILNSACGANGPAFQCYKMVPWAVNENLSYGWGATSSGDICGRCFELEFTGEGYYAWSPGAEAIQGKKMIIQAINIGYDVANGQVDILVPGGGVGLYNACSTQWGIPADELGVQYGGLLSACQNEHGYQDLEALKKCLRERNNSLFRSRGLTQMAEGLDWFIDWYQAADNPRIIRKEVPCPQEITDKSGMKRP